MNQTFVALLIATALSSGFLSGASVAQAQSARTGVMRALVIGINDYQYVPKLKGATADAHDIESSLRKAGASDVKLMLDASVTRGSLLVEFESLVTRSQPGDVVVLSVSGHGAQEPERVKGSEPDGMDEVFLLPGFDPKSRERNSEKILDKEFNHFVKRIEERGARVLFIADTCSGGGLARDVDPRAEEMSYRAVKYTPLEDDLKSVASRADAFLSPADFRNSNFLAAVDKQSKVPEVRVPGIGFRGALSYAVARGLEGAADLDDDGSITVDELFNYANRVTYQLSDQRQKIVTANALGKNPKTDVLVSFDRGISVVPVQPGQNNLTQTQQSAQPSQSQQATPQPIRPSQSPQPMPQSQQPARPGPSPQATNQPQKTTQPSQSQTQPQQPAQPSKTQQMATQPQQAMRPNQSQQA